jgi:hypothetical protein
LQHQDITNVIDRFEAPKYQNRFLVHNGGVKSRILLDHHEERQMIDKVARQRTRLQEKYGEKFADLLNRFERNEKGMGCDCIFCFAERELSHSELRRFERWLELEGVVLVPNWDTPIETECCYADSDGSNNTIGWAVVPIGSEGLCYTSAPEAIAGGSVWQIYTNEEDANAFCEEVKFWDANYRVVQVEITLQ